MKIVQFQVVANTIIYALDEEGRLWFRNSSVGGGAWQQLEDLPS